MKAWRQAREDHPGTYTAASILPITGQLTAVADYAEAMDRNDSADATRAAASFVPGVRLAKLGTKIAPSAYRPTMTAVEKAIDPAVRNSVNVGRVAAADQVREYVDRKISPTEDQKQYVEAWGNEARR